MWRTGSTVCVQTGQLALTLNDLCVCIQDVRKLAVKADTNIVSKLRMFCHQPLGGPHDKFEMSDVITLFGGDHQELVLFVRPAMQPIAPIKHEYFERGDAILQSEAFHLINMCGFDRSNVKPVVDPKSAIGLLEHFRHELTVWTAAIEIVLPSTHVVDARRHPTHRRCLAFRNGILGQGLIDADMHVGINAAGERQKIFGVEGFLGALCVDRRRDLNDLSVFDRDVEPFD
jgi:hypothetical protein